MRHLGNMPPGLPRGPLEEVDPNFAIWWYGIPTPGRKDVRMWAFALRSMPDAHGGLKVYETSKTQGGFKTRAEAIRWGNISACVRARKEVAS